MKILLVHNSYQQPGGEDVVFEQEGQLLERYGHEVIRYRRSNRELEGLSGLQRLVLVKNIISAADSKSDIDKILRAQKPDLVHVHNTFMMISPSIYEVCQKAEIPVVQTLHNYRLLCPGTTHYRDGQVCEECTEHSLMRGVWHGCYRDSQAITAAVALMLTVHRARGTWTKSVDGYIALTEFSRQKFIEGGLPASRIHVKPNIVASDPGKSNGRGGYAVFVGRLSPEKGLSTLLAAWKLLSVSVPLMIVGDGPLRQRLEAEAERNGLWNVTFRGHVSNPDTREAIKQAAFLILPSLWYEGFPMVIAESLACGTPVLASRLGSTGELIDDGRTGLHFTAGDASDLARKVEWAWSHSSELAEMGHAARGEYETLYTPEKNYLRLMDIYEWLLSDCGHSAKPIAC